MFLSAEQARRRFLLLRGLRWLATGLLIPVMILLMLRRGFSLGDIGVITAAQGLMVLLLELPTGGITDVVGRRATLLVASVVSLCSTALYVVAESLPLLMVVFALQGIYRAFDSGPLEAWYVDTAQAADPAANIERGLSRGTVAMGVAVGAGSLLSSGLVAIAPLNGNFGALHEVEPLVLPLLASIVLEIAHLVAVAMLMTDPARPHRSRRGRALRMAMRSTPHTVSQAVQLIGTNKVLLALTLVGLLWGFGMTTIETFTPARLGEVLGDTDRAAALFGPAQAVAWLLFAGGASAAPTLVRWLGAPYAAAVLWLAQAATAAGIALASGPIGVLAAFLAALTVHGATDPVHLGLLHRAVSGPTHRATIVSAGNLTTQLGATLGGITLGAMADATTLPTAIIIGALFLAAAATLYLPVRNIQKSAERTTRN